MTRRFRPLTAAVLALLPAAALADLTAEDVWASHQAVFAALGGRADSTATRDGDRLLLSGLTVTWSPPMGDAQLVLTTDGYQFRERGDGTVAVLYPADMTYEFSLEHDGEKQPLAQMTVQSDRLDVIASGTANDITYAARLTGVEAELSTSLAVADAADPSLTGDHPIFVAATISIDSVQQDARVTLSDLVGITATYIQGALRVRAQMKDALGTLTEQTSESTENTLRLALALPPQGIALMNPNPALQQGARLDISSTADQVHSTETATRNGAQVHRMRYNLDKIENRLVLGADRFQMKYAVDAIEGWFARSDLPVPVSGALGTFDFTLDLPVTASDDAQPASLGLTLRELTFDDATWAIADPNEVLDRGPLDVALDLGATALLSVSAFDIPVLQQALAAGRRPVELADLTLSNLSVQAFGAALTGQGAVALDFDDMESYPGIPKPTGTIDLALSGLEPLLDQLQAAGLIGDAQLTGLRMMLAGFSTPDPDAPGTLRSHIELNAEGQVLANGLRLR